jgi:pimeloyl-ACP methyl ester carboxylesterase
MAREQVHVIGRSAADPAAVWTIAREFCAPWHPLIATMQTERSATGAQIRAFTVKGEDTLYREQLTYISESDQTLAYTHLQGIAGADHYAARLTVTPAEAGGSVITMTAQITASASRATDIATGTKAIFDIGVKALAELAEAATPREEPLATRHHVTLHDIYLDEAPRLALTVTPPKTDILCLFLHGIGGGRANWTAQLSESGAVMRSAALDLRGYGDSTLGFQQSAVDDYCADILRVAEALGAKKLVLCGLSYGSWIATSFAMRHPEMLAGLILSGGCTGMSEAGPEEREAFRLSREVPMNAGQTPADFAPAVVKVLASPNATEATRETLQASMAAIPSATYRDALTCFTNPLERFDFSKLTMPVLMMTGEHDRLAPPTEIRAVAARISDAQPLADVRYETIAGAGHVCNLEAPAAYNHHLLAFLKKVTP